MLLTATLIGTNVSNSITNASLPSDDKVKAWTHIRRNYVLKAQGYVFTAWFLIKHRNNSAFTFTFTDFGSVRARKRYYHILKEIYLQTQSRVHTVTDAVKFIKY